MTDETPETRETPETIPSLEDTGEEATDAQQEQAGTQPEQGQKTGSEQTAPQGENMNPAESTEKIGTQDQVEGQTGA